MAKDKEPKSQTEMDTDDFHTRVGQSFAEANFQPKQKLLKIMRTKSKMHFKDSNAEKLNKSMSEADAKEKAYQERIGRKDVKANIKEPEKQLQKTSVPKVNMSAKTVLGIDLKKGITGKK